MREWFATYITVADQEDLITYLREMRKPRIYNVQTCLFALTTLNSIIPHLPGTQPQLNEASLRTAFHDMMPQVWRDKFIGLGRIVTATPLAELRTYYGQQERLTDANQRNIQQRQRDAGRGGGRNGGRPNGGRGNGRARGGGRGSRAREYPAARRRGNDPPEDRRVRHRSVQNGDLCPIHVNSNHTWGECNLNVENPNRVFRPAGRGGGRGNGRGGGRGNGRGNGRGAGGRAESNVVEDAAAENGVVEEGEMIPEADEAAAAGPAQAAAGKNNLAQPCPQEVTHEFTHHLDSFFASDAYDDNSTDDYATCPILNVRSVV